MVYSKLSQLPDCYIRNSNIVLEFVPYGVKRLSAQTSNSLLNCKVFYLYYIQAHKKLVTRVGTVVDQKKVLKPAGVVHDIKLQ